MLACAQVKAGLVERMLAGSYEDVVRDLELVGDDLFVRRLPKVDPIPGTRLDHECDVCFALESCRSASIDFAFSEGQQAVESRH